MQNSEQLKLPPINSMNSSGPFKIPNDNDILLNNDNTRSKVKDQKIWDKATASCRNPLKRFDKFETPIDDKYVPINSYNNKEKKMIESALEIIQMRKKNKDLVGKNQTIVDILEQKKQMFLVTMTHGIIEKQIQNLKQQADQRQRALKDSNQILSQDIQDFQKFQQKQKLQTKKSEQNYEQQVKKRLAIQQQIKNKQIIFNSLRAQKSRNQQNISSYQKYKKFLNQLPPQQWINEQQKKKQQRLSQEKQKMYAQWLATQDKKVGQNKLKADFQIYFNKLKQSGENQKIQEIINHQQMYFDQPHQLIEYFNNLQEANLFCIQNVQIADQKLQELMVKSEQRKKQLVAKYQLQLDQKKTLEKQLFQMQNQIKLLRKKREQNGVLDQKDNKDIKSVIAAEYQTMKQLMTNTYLPEIQHNAQALALLSGIQICMERLWQKLRQFYMQNTKLVKSLKIQYQKEKTIQKRVDATKKNSLQDQKRKERNLQKKQPTTKIYGRVDMKRSAPNGKITKSKPQQSDKNVNDDNQYFIQ